MHTDLTYEVPIINWKHAALCQYKAVARAVQLLLCANQLRYYRKAHICHMVSMFVMHHINSKMVKGHLKRPQINRSLIYSMDIYFCKSLRSSSTTSRFQPLIAMPSSRRRKQLIAIIQLSQSRTASSKHDVAEQHKISSHASHFIPQISHTACNHSNCGCKLRTSDIQPQNLTMINMSD